MTRQAQLDTFFNGHCLDGHQIFGAHLVTDGVHFGVYAPAAKNVFIKGDFSQWQGISLIKTDERGLWEITLPQAHENDLYKYDIEGQDGLWREKSDPYGFYQEVRPDNASRVVSLAYSWQDQTWLNQRSLNHEAAMNIYECHLGSWIKPEDKEFYSYEEVADQLIPYLQRMAFTHVEFMPLSEFPFDGSWGYQATGFYACTSRYGWPHQLQGLIDRLHQAGIGVILDVVPSHFVRDDHGLARFDGTALYEYSHADQANSEWGTLYFDYQKDDVRSFMLSAFSFWIETYHIDGLRMDAISNLIYWGGRKERSTNAAALEFLRICNIELHQRHATVMTIAEDSSDYPRVSVPVFSDGLGFDYKWDLGWMNDTLNYYHLDPEFRHFHHHDLTFSMAYFYQENFILPLSHDEVVHGKRAVVDKMWGDYEQKFAQAKNLYLYMMTHPGKKLNFMGNEIAHFREWDENKPLDWFLLDYPMHHDFQRYFTDLARIYAHYECLHHDYDALTFKWLDADNFRDRIYCYQRRFNDQIMIIVLNMSMVSYETYSVNGVAAGSYMELINSERDIYHGCNMGNFKPIKVTENGCFTLRLAPFAGVIFLRDEASLV